MAQNINSFAQTPELGMLDQRFNFNTISCLVDTTESGSLVAGQAVKVVDSADGVPKVVAVEADTDEVFGFVNYDIKSKEYIAGDALEISQAGNVIYLLSTAAISRGAQVGLDESTVGGVQPLSSSSGANIVGWAMDKAAGSGELIRVKVSCPSFAFDA